MWPDRRWCFIAADGAAGRYHRSVSTPWCAGVSFIETRGLELVTDGDLTTCFDVVAQGNDGSDIGRGATEAGQTAANGFTRAGKAIGRWFSGG